MAPLIAALIATLQPAAAAEAVTLGRTASIFSTIGHSEFCPAGNVMVDPTTGLYAVTRRATRRVCNEAGLERAVQKGKLSQQNLRLLRSAYRRVLSDGLMSPVCRDGAQPDDVIVSNGGTPILVLTTGSSSGSAPDDPSCWSEAASALHDTLDRTFSSAGHQ